MALRKFLVITLMLFLTLAMMLMTGIVLGPREAAAYTYPNGWQQEWVLDMGRFVCVNHAFNMQYVNLCIVVIDK